jgi:hypothetical protein
MDIPVLTPVEVRVLGSLIEKDCTTPDYYPLSLNALVNACNQLNNRDPVVIYGEADVNRAMDSLRDKQLAYVVSGGVNRVLKFGHKFPAAFELSRAETAALCVLLLRGPQTAGEIRSRSGRLHEFADLADVQSTLSNLVGRPQPLVVCLPRQPGTKESRYAHLLGGEVAAPPAPAVPEPVVAPAAPVVPPDRLAALEAEVAGLRREVTELRQQLSDLRQLVE